MPEPFPPPGLPLFLFGPTAVGKSLVALDLAERLHGEIISVDSMQVYRGLNIGTAKPSSADQQRIPHHLIDVVDVTEPFDAAQFVALAREALAQIQARSRIPVFCGGTGLYLKAWMEGLGKAPPSDPQLRAELEKIPLPLLLDELARTDPATFNNIDKKNRRRIVRALEVVRLTGVPFSQQRASWRPRALGQTPPCQAGCFGLWRHPADLHHRIDQRVEAMFRQGLVAETENLLLRGLDRNPGALQAIGYRQVAEFLRGIRSLEETISLVKQRTRLYARRQMTWFRHQAPLTWLTLEPQEPVSSISARILDALTLHPAGSHPRAPWKSQPEKP